MLRVHLSHVSGNKKTGPIPVSTTSADSCPADCPYGQFRPSWSVAMIREQLIAIYLDWRNNYLTVAKFAEHNGLTEDEAETLIDLARLVFSHDSPEA